MDDIAARRLGPEELERNFADIHVPLDRKRALIEASRCYFCHDAPCIEACPTSIDIPNFIRMINTGNTLGCAARCTGKAIRECNGCRAAAHHPARARCAES